MRQEEWEMLVALRHTENITQAAQRLFLSQPTLTLRLKKLETYYGVQLIIRKQRGIIFTPEGEKLALHAQKMLHEQRRIEEQLHNMKDQFAGTIRVGVSNFFALNKMPKLLCLFKRKYPDVEFKVVTGWSSAMHRLILNHDVHIAFIKGDYIWNENKHLLYEEEICIASPWDFEWQDLPHLPRIDYHTDEKMRSIVDQWWYRTYKQSPNINIQVNQVETCKEMVINGLGYAIIANLVVRPYTDLFIKPIQLPSGEKVTRKTWMYYHEETLNLNIVKAFVEFVETLDVRAL